MAALAGERMNDFERDKKNNYPVISYLKTGARIQYKDTVVDLVEWRCPDCCHRWWEYSDAGEYPECCPLCGYRFND